MADLDVFAVAFRVAGFGHHAISDGQNGGAGGGGVVRAVMGFGPIEDGVETLEVVPAADAAEFHRCLEEGLAEAVAVLVKVVVACALVKPVRRQHPVAVLEVAHDDTGHADGLVVDVHALVQHVERIPFLQPRKVHGPGVNRGHGQGEVGGCTDPLEVDVKAGLNDALGALNEGVGGVGFQGDAVWWAQVEPGVLGGVALVNEVPGGLHAVFVKGDPVGLLGADVADVVGGFGFVGEVGNGSCRDASGA